MTTEEKAKAYDMALESARKELEQDLHESGISALQRIFPQLKESEDERIRKFLIDYFGIIKSTLSDDGIWKGFQIEEILAFLKKQKENIKKEYVFRPLAGTDINSAASQAIRRVNKGDSLVLAFNGAYIPVRKGCNANKIVDIYEKHVADTIAKYEQEEQKPTDKSINWTELTWKDIVELEGIINNVYYDFSDGIGQESFGKEVLERFRSKKDDAEVDACEQKQKGLEEEIQRIVAKYSEMVQGEKVMKPSGIEKIAHHFYKLGRKQVLQEIYDGKTKPVDKITAAWLDDKKEESK